MPTKTVRQADKLTALERTASRVEKERELIRNLITNCRKQGFEPVRFWNSMRASQKGGDGEYIPTRTTKAALEAFAESEGGGTLHFRDTKEPDSDYGVLLIAGNGEDVISDYHSGNERLARAVRITCGMKVE